MRASGRDDVRLRKFRERLSTESQCCRSTGVRKFIHETERKPDHIRLHIRKRLRALKQEESESEGLVVRSITRL